MDTPPEGLADHDIRRALLNSVEEVILAETGNRLERMVFLDGSGGVVSTCDGDRDGVNLTGHQFAHLEGRV